MKRRLPKPVAAPAKRLRLEVPRAVEASSGDTAKARTSDTWGVAAAVGSNASDGGRDCCGVGGDSGATPPLAEVDAWGFLPPATTGLPPAAGRSGQGGTAVGLGAGAAAQHFRSKVIVAVTDGFCERL